MKILLLPLRLLSFIAATPFLFWLSSSVAGLDAEDALHHGHFVEAIEQTQRDIVAASTPSARIKSLLVQGEAYRALGHWSEAGQSLEQALHAATESGATFQQGQALSALTRVRSNELDSSESPLTRAHDLLAPAGPSAELAEVELQLGEQAAQRGDPATAARHYEQARQTATRATAPLAAVGALLAQARLQAITQHPTDAERTLAVIVTQLRTAPPSHQVAMAHLAVGRIFRTLATDAGDRRLRTAYDAFQGGLAVARGLQDDYAIALANGELGELYAEQGRSEEALQFYRHALFSAQTFAVPLQYRWEWRSARLLERLGQYDQAIMGYRRAIEQSQGLQLPQTEDSFRESSGALFLEFADLLLRRSEQTNSEEQRTALLRQVQGVIEQLKSAELKDYFKDECLRDLQSKENAIAGALTENTTAVLYPLLLPNRTIILVSRGNHIFQRTSPMPTSEVMGNAQRLRALLEKRSTYQYLAPARRLYDALIRPIEAELEGVDTLVFVPDSVLRLVPLAVFNDGAHYLLERFAAATSPGLSITDFGNRNRHPEHTLISALTEARQGFPALPNVAVETDYLEKLLPSTVLKDQGFELDNLRRSLSSNSYDIIHLASHGYFEGKGHDSFILTYDNHLSLNQLERFMRLTRFKDEPVELLTMSACQTAVGDDRAALGLGGVAVKAGARSALATLWLVNDEATALLMGQFYHQLAISGQTKAQALRQAQMALIKAGPYQHAGLWAPFLLIGNWH